MLKSFAEYPERNAGTLRFAQNNSEDLRMKSEGLRTTRPELFSSLLD
jgi:hypothetical protein